VTHVRITSRERYSKGTHLKLLPYLQVAQEAWGIARVFGGLLGVDSQKAIGIMLDLWQLGIGTGPDDGPPDGMITGSDAPTVVAAALSWPGETARLMRALSHPSVRLIDISPDCIRIRGIDRYAKAWERNEKARQRVRTFRERTRYDDGTFSTKTKTKTKTKIESKTLLTSTSVDEPAELQKLWNDVADSSLPRCRELTAKRRTHAKARLADRTLTEWRTVIERINQSSFCRGSGDNSWRATFDWLLRPDTAAKVLEGTYDDRDRADNNAPPRRILNTAEERAAWQRGEI